MKRIASALLVSTFLLGGCASTTDVRTEADNDTGAAQGQKKGSSAAKAGQKITLAGNLDGEKVAVTAMKVADPVRATDGFSEPASGMRYVAVQFRIENTGKAPYDDSPSNGAKVIDPDGQQFDSTIVGKITAGAMLPASVKVPPGGKALGYIVFEVPKKSKIVKVQFGMNSGFGDTGEWTV